MPRITHKELEIFLIFIEGSCGIIECSHIFEVEVRFWIKEKVKK